MKAKSLLSVLTLCTFLSAQAAESPATTAPLYWAWWGWEPIDHNRRVGGTAGAVDGSSWWLPKWYDRLHSEDLVRLMSEQGINLAVTHFFKGFGLKHEHAQQQRTAELARIAHTHGIRVLGYCQGNSLYYETLLAEEPKAADWAQRDANGRPVLWGNKYYRWSPCIHSTAFRAYLKRAIRAALKDAQLDGINFDNTYSGPCYCERCEKDFREWLTRRYPQPLDLFGIGTFAHVCQPPGPSSNARIEDALMRAWVRWRCESLDDFMRDITSYARSLRADAILMSNPSHPVAPGGPLRRSVWPVWVGRHLNLMIAENSASPEKVGDALITQIRAYKQGRAVGYRTVSTTWAGALNREASGEASLALPQTASVVQLQVAEAAANGGVPGANWATRPLGSGNGMRIDRADLREALRSYLGFVRKHENLILSAKPVRDVAVLHTFPSLAFDAQYAWDRLAAAEEILIRGGYSWEVVFDDQLQRLDGFSVLVLSGQSYLTDRACDAIKSFVDRGGGIVILGENGKYDDEGRSLEKNRLDILQGSRVIRLDFTPARNDSAKGHAICVKLPTNWKKVAEAIEQAANGRLSAHQRSSTEVALSASLMNDGRLVVHLVNYAAPQQSPPLQVELGEAMKDRRAARLLTPAASELKLPLRRDGNRLLLEVPPLDAYGIVVVE